MPTHEQIDEIMQFLSEHARGVQVLPCFWINGWDEGLNYCLKCCEYEVSRLQSDNSLAEHVEVDGGWSTEHDSVPFCDRCGARLQGSLTEYGASLILQSVRESPVDWLEREGWYDLEQAIGALLDQDVPWALVGRAVRRARRQERRHIKQLYLRSQLPGMSDARSGLLGALVRRAQSIKAEPSFPMWRELEVFRLTPYVQRDPKMHDLLFEQARKFIESAGIPVRGDCGVAPYGTYWWGCVVEIEQERLWNFPEFQQGARRADEDPESTRDDNPYKERARARSWDCGYVGGSKRGRDA